MGALEAVAWLLAGVLIGALNLSLAAVFVARLRPAKSRRLRFRVIRSYVIRYAIAMLLLALAVRQGIRAGLAAAAGIWVARWLGVYLGSTGRLDWMWSL